MGGGGENLGKCITSLTSITCSRCRRMFSTDISAVEVTDKMYLANVDIEDV